MFLRSSWYNFDFCCFHWLVWSLHTLKANILNGVVKLRKKNCNNIGIFHPSKIEHSIILKYSHVACYNQTTSALTQETQIFFSFLIILNGSRLLSKWNHTLLAFLVSGFSINIMIWYASMLWSVWLIHSFWG